MTSYCFHSMKATFSFSWLTGWQVIVQLSAFPARADRAKWTMKLENDLLYTTMYIFVTLSVTWGPLVQSRTILVITHFKADLIGYDITWCHFPALGNRMTTIAACGVWHRWRDKTIRPKQKQTRKQMCDRDTHPNKQVLNPNLMITSPFCQ